jgi:hypothetical protein
MIDHQMATAQAVRLKILQKYPKSEKGEEALIAALQEAAETGYIAEKFVTGWIRSNKNCPMPCDIYQGLDAPGRIKSNIRSFPAIPKGQEIPPPTYLCNLCEDTGWYILELKQVCTDFPSTHYTGAKRCTHPPEYRGSGR